MIHTIGIKTAHGSILDLKKELLLFDQIHMFGDTAAWHLSEILIPDEPNLDPVLSVHKALKTVEDLMATGRSDNQLLTQIYTEYNVLSEMGLLVDTSESEILTETLKDKKKYRKSRSGKSKADEFHNMNHLLVILDDAIKKFDKMQPESISSIKKGQKIEDIPLEEFLKKEVNEFVYDKNLMIEISNEIIARLYAFVMNFNERARFIPILQRLSGWKSEEPISENVSGNKLKVINAVFKSLPMPDVNTPLTEVLDFRKDSEAKGHILALNNWIIEASTKNLTALELEQKIEHLIFEYNRFINLNKLKFQATKFELVITSLAEVAENLVRLKFSKLAKSMFSLFKNDVALFESEMSAPGREVAYISSARSKFSV
jgi:hypothetical protein